MIDAIPNLVLSTGKQINEKNAIVVHESIFINVLKHTYGSNFLKDRYCVCFDIFGPLKSF
jgi:hypothetical protein